MCVSIKQVKYLQRRGSLGDEDLRIEGSGAPGGEDQETAWMAVLKGIKDHNTERDVLREKQGVL